MNGSERSVSMSILATENYSRTTRGRPRRDGKNFLSQTRVVREKQKKRKTVIPRFRAFYRNIYKKKKKNGISCNTSVGGERRTAVHLCAPRTCPAVTRKILFSRDYRSRRFCFVLLLLFFITRDNFHCRFFFFLNLSSNALLCSPDDCSRCCGARAKSRDDDACVLTAGRQCYCPVRAAPLVPYLGEAVLY